MANEKPNEKYNYDIVMADIKNTMYKSIPLGIYVVIFIFTALLEIASVNFDVTVVLHTSFWAKLVLKYIIAISVLSVMYPYFKNNLENSNDSKEIKNKARKTNDKLSKNMLTTEYKEYTKVKMQQEESDYFKELLAECGNCDSKYLDREWTIKKLRIEKKNDRLNKYQFKLLKSIKSGKLTFAKLRGDEIKYVGAYTYKKNKKYQNQQASIVSIEIIIKFASMFVIGVAMEILLDSMLEGDVETKYDFVQTLVKIFSVVMNYAISTHFALKTAQKSVDEYMRFTEVVTAFTQEFLETKNIPYESEVA